VSFTVHPTGFAAGQLCGVLDGQRRTASLGGVCCRIMHRWECPLLAQGGHCRTLQNYDVCKMAEGMFATERLIFHIQSAQFRIHPPSYPPWRQTTGKFFQISSALRLTRTNRIRISGVSATGHCSEFPNRSKSEAERNAVTKFAISSVGIIVGISRSLFH
jgi:hypothetical protein